MGAKTGTYPNELIELTSLDNDDTILIVRGNNIFTTRASVLATGGITVENVLTSDSETNALSAAQGKALNTALSSKAALGSPAFTGNPTAPTAAAATDNNEIATTAFVHDIAAWILTPTINTQFDGDYTLQPVDNDGKTYLRMDYPTANEVLIPISQTRTITIRQSGDGITTLVADTGVTLNGNPVFSGAGDTKTLVPLYVDEFESEWDIIGATA